MRTRFVDELMTTLIGRQRFDILNRHPILREDEEPSQEAGWAGGWRLEAGDWRLPYLTRLLPLLNLLIR